MSRGPGNSAASIQRAGILGLRILNTFYRDPKESYCEVRKAGVIDGII